MLFGSSGIRRRFDHDLIRIALQTGSALGNRGDTLILGTDTRTTNGILSGALISGVLSSGGDVKTAGIVPTPVVAYATRHCVDGLHGDRVP